MSQSPLRQAREQKGWSQRQLAEYVDTNTFTVGRWESGLSFPSPHYRQKLCEVFACSIEALGLLPAQKKRPRGASEKDANPNKAVVQAIYPASVPGAPLRRLVGRDALLQSLKQQLCGSNIPARIALHGLPGVGKTSVLTALAADPEVRARFPGGVLWAGLGPQPQLTLLLQQWGKSLGLATEELAAIADIDALCHRLQAAIDQQAALILIDDAWQIEHALACSIGGAQCGHVMTTRSLALATQFSPQATLLVPELDDMASLELLRHLAPQVVDTEATASETLVRVVGGLPLALTIMGHYLHQHSIGNQPRRIQAAVQALQRADARLQVAEPIAPAERPPALPPGASLSLQTTIAISDALLDEQAQQLLHAVAVLPAKPACFDEMTARAISGIAPATFDRALDALIDAGLVEGVAPEEFTMHQVIADYGRSFAHQAVDQRLIAHAVTTMEAHQQEYEQLARQFALLTAALELAAEHDPAHYVRGVIAIAPFLNSRSLFPEIQQHVSRALALTDESASRAMLLAHGASARKNAGDYAQAQAWAEEGMCLARTLADAHPLLLLLNVSSELLITLGQTRRAEELIREGLAIAIGSAQHEIVCRLLTRLAQVEERHDELAQAEEHLLHALQLADDLGKAGQVQASAILTGLGVLRGKQGDFIGSATYSRQGIVIARRLGYFERCCGLLINLSHALRELGQFQEAETTLHEAAVIAREHGLRVRLCGILSNLSMLLADRGALALAEERIHEGLALAYELGSFERIAGALNSRAHVALLRKDTVTAAAAISEGLERARKAEDAYFVNTFLCCQGEVLLQQGCSDAAMVAFQEALLLAIAAQRQHLHAQALYGLARVAASGNQNAEAVQLGHESLRYYNLIQHPQAEEVQMWLAALPQNGHVPQARSS